MAGPYRDYRIVYEIHDNVLLVLVVAVGHRSEATTGAEQRPTLPLSAPTHGQSAFAASARQREVGRLAANGRTALSTDRG